MQTFLDVSRRRAEEARALLAVPKRHRDGAAVCALLAAECALKATLLYGLQATTLDEVPESTRKKAFQSKLGHDLGALWNLQAATVKAQTTSRQEMALKELNGRDRYAHRYGFKKPDKPTAEQMVDWASELVDWMKEVVR